MQNKKGFTLVEVILILFLIGLLLTSSLTTYFNSAKTFNYLDAYKSVILPIRTARGYALANKNGGVVEKYGVRITKDCVAFLEIKSGDDPFDLEDGSIQDLCKAHDSSDIGNFPDFLNHSMSVYFEDGDYEIGLPTGEENFNLYIFYETGTGNLTAYESVSEASQTPISKTSVSGKDIWISVKDSKDEELQQYIVILTVSGLAEESLELPSG